MTSSRAMLTNASVDVPVRESEARTVYGRSSERHFLIDYVIDLSSPSSSSFIFESRTNTISDQQKALTLLTFT